MKKEKSLVQDYQNGMLYRDLMKKYSCGTKYIVNVIKRNNVERRLKSFVMQTKLTSTDIKDIVEQYKQGTSIQNLSVKYKTHTSRIRQLLQENNIFILNKNYSGQRIENDLITFKKMLLDNKISISDIGKKYDVTDKVIYRIINKYNLPYVSKDHKKQNHPRWQGKRHDSGYIQKIYNGVYKHEHREIIEKSIQRKLSSSEIVHHINCLKYDNRIENLYLCKNTSEHTKIHKNLNNLLYTILPNLIDDGYIRFNKKTGEYEVFQ